MAKNTNRSKRKVSRHHIRPRSRIKRGDKNKDNLVTLDAEFHSNWHRMFENMTVAEAHRFIDLVMVPGKRWDNSSLYRLRKEIMEEESDD